MRKIPLTNGDFLIVNDEDYPFMAQFKDWKRKESEGTEGKYHAVREIRLGQKRLTIRAHRLIVEARPDQRVTALDDNLLNCTRVNLHIRTLRPWTGRPMHSGFRGVHQINSGTWKAESEFAGQHIILSDKCDDPVKGAHVYDAAARKLYGINAQTNF